MCLSSRTLRTSRWLLTLAIGFALVLAAAPAVADEVAPAGDAVEVPVDEEEDTAAERRKQIE